MEYLTYISNSIASMLHKIHKVHKVWKMGRSIDRGSNNWFSLLEDVEEV